MKKFIGYFDYLGFKDFILNNDLEYQTQIMGNNFRDIESSLGKGKLLESNRGMIADLSASNINCINFSDTVVFWTNDDSENSLKELIEVTYRFNWQAVLYCFPLRGSILYGDIVHVDYRKPNEGGGLYNINSIFGEGIVQAYLKAEEQNWAGTVIDQSVIDFLINHKIDPESYLTEFAKKYRIPYKNKIENSEEQFALRLVVGQINEEAFQNLSRTIKTNFSDHNKNTSNQRVREIVENTLKYLESFKQNG